ncbi:MAG: nucleotidyltransferase family protein, partial [Bacteroidales bacterium]|nr:nucleotidyltransferase family protein [Bacteroidales bacterium]
IKFDTFVKYHSLQHWYFLKFQKDPFLLGNEDKKLIENEIKNVKLQNLLLWTEWQKIERLALEKKINLFLFKGIALSKQLYNDAFLRPTRDLDIYVDFNDIVTAEEIFLALGYKRVKPNFVLNEVQLKKLKNHLHHFSYYHSTNKVLIELHWQLFVPEKLMPHGARIMFGKQNNEKHEGLFRYNPNVLLHYLMIHASMHHWFKLVWLSDMDRLIRNNSIDWNEFNMLTSTFRDERMVNVSFALLQKYFETFVNKEIKLNKAEQKIYKIAQKSIENRENFLTFKGIKRVKRVYFLSLLKKDWIYKWYCWYAPMTNLEDWKSLPLPNYLFGFYFVFRPFLWFYHNYLKR